MAAEVAIDVGYGYTKVIGGRMGEPIHFPSVVGEATPVDFAPIFVTAPQALEYKGAKYYVGDIAMEHSNAPQLQLERDRTMSTVYEILFLSALQQVARLPDEIKVVTGLPIAWYSDIDKARKLLRRTHRWKWGGESRKVKVTHLEILPQPLGTLYLQVLGPNGVILDRNLFQSRVGIVGCGTCTVNLAVSSGGQYIRHESSSAPIGLAQAARSVIAMTPKMSLTLPMALDALTTPEIIFCGELVSLRHQVYRALSDYSMAVVEFVNQIWADKANRFSKILLTGGGAPIVYDTLRREVPGVELVREHFLANVLGYARYGKCLTRNRAWR